MFDCHNAVREPLQSPYDAPKSVLKWADKHYTLEIGNRKEVVSLDLLKPAYMEYDLAADFDVDAHAHAPAQPTKSPVTTTRSGRQIRRPQARTQLRDWGGRLPSKWNSSYAYFFNYNY